MAFSLSHQPILRSKQESLDIQDLQGSWRINWQIQNRTILSTIYTRVDQVFLIWGAIACLMFGIAQFFPVSWTTQAYIWSGLTLIGAGCMIFLTHFWARVERLLWLVYTWAALMLVGIFLTDLGIFGYWGIVLMNLCPLWLGISGVGYLVTGLGIESRTFIGLAVVHFLGILLVQQYPSWQFLMTGLVIGGSLLLLAQIQWDMRSPIEYAVLTDEQKAFNRQQQQLRQRSV
ncbi:hypothetical protein [Calothrix sp. NIES-3974]|uniref:hypothetical protein n=1 Tax=Calothrix sp. NIES-3974 TaxID=2005462 RepID=UPI000B600CF2|nr:hypothetical protein [Calothrix sp. NIES-3974]BAZ08016.1 hypothetical protein NIES3974_46840 [Calothrix sp. NIES-3974]